MDVEADIMAQAVNEILAERLAIAVLTVGIDVVVCDFVEAVVAFAAEVHTRLYRGQRGVLRAQHDFINFALPRREFAIGRKSSRNVRGVSGELCADVEQDDVAVFDFARQLVVVEDSGIEPGSDDGRIAFGFGASHGVDFHHAGRDLILEQARPHYAHGF